MHGFSTVDGFVEISNCMAEMIKYVANEPSAGLFFIQQHTQNAVPNIMKLKKNVSDKSRETTLHTEDLEDSVTMVRSMKDCGFPIADEMIVDIKKSLITITSKKANRWLTHRPTSSFQAQRANFSKQNSYSPKGPPLDSMGMVNSSAEKPQLHHSVSLPDASANTNTFSQADKKPPSSQVEDECRSQPGDIGEKLLSVSEKYDDFKACKQAKLEEWLEGTSNNGDNSLPGDEKRLRNK
ncbi:hypothetical protein V8G54_030320 [Vigna mungo]|uniref:Uncharacterized protein n=1 Tax=Vigna mungo TaxID=3915 RepID=A0AAQ3MUZ2_VIGMU